MFIQTLRNSNSGAPAGQEAFSVSLSPARGGNRDHIVLRRRSRAQEKTPFSACSTKRRVPRLPLTRRRVSHKWLPAMRQHSNLPTGKRLLGFLLQMGYDEMSLVTCDAWKKNCGGVPRNSFVIVKLNEKAAGVTVPAARRAIILARISATTTTPVANDIQSTIFQIHKVQATVDPLTSAELQWGALSATILGTYYDNADGSIGFGNDVDNFMSPHFYEVYAAGSLSAPGAGTTDSARSSFDGNARLRTISLNCTSHVHSLRCNNPVSRF